MTSGTLSVKKHTFRGIFAWTIKKNAIMTLIASILAIIVNPCIMVTNYYKAQNYSFNYNFSFNAGNYHYVAESILALMAVVLIILYTCMNFSHMHSRKISDFWNALPITRNNLLLARFLGTLTSVMIPAVISYAGETLFAAVIPGLNLDVLMPVKSFGFLILFAFICTAMAVFFCVICGNTFDVIASLIVTNCGWPAIVGIYITRATYSLVGFTGINTFESFFFLSPFGRIFCHPVTNYSALEATKIYILWGLYGIAILAAALFLYRRRRNEVSGIAYAYKAVPVAMQCVVGFVAGFILGMIFSFTSTISDYHSLISDLTFYIFFGIGAMLGVIIYGAIASRGFKTIIRSLIIGAIVTAVSLTSFMVLETGGLGYEKRIPKESSVQAVTLTVNGNDIKFTDPEDIDTIWNLHRKIAENLDKIANNNPMLNDYVADSDYYFYTIQYNLSLGRKMARKYGINNSTFKEELYPLLASKAYIYGSEDVYAKADLLSDMTSYNVNSLSSNDKESYVEENIPSEDFIEGLVEAYKKDLDTVTTENYTDKKLYDIQLNNSYQYNYSQNKPYKYMKLSVKKNYHNTIQYLKDQGILKKISESKYYSSSYTY